MKKFMYSSIAKHFEERDISKEEATGMGKRQRAESLYRFFKRCYDKQTFKDKVKATTLRGQDGQDLQAKYERLLEENKQLKLYVPFQLMQCEI